MSNYYGCFVNPEHRYDLDDYSTPDEWRGVGYELQYDVLTHLADFATTRAKELFLQEVIDTFLKVFNLPGNRIRYFRWHSNEQDIKQPFTFIVLVYYDKGPFNLRTLNRLEVAMDRVAVENHTRVVIDRLLIIPRSKETITWKINTPDWKIISRGN